ncbi:hypothetical protein [Desulforhopalus singaporensis]|uniref:Uncharacterized protein n=1 Tax=Desulforhopalus singaporensis TaxID=91360 RepID=A0A1H0TTS2_9BACT|nr:hypothetical protein [Desulforhopalus singaporensis]SDP57271.1 hypothetical protein SAMN05660330_03236 [Desulforhopalus singaporensis]
MKYAIIAMVAIYLITFGCSPDSDDQNSTSHEQPIVESTVETGHTEASAPAVEEHQAAVAEESQESAEATHTADAVEEKTTVEHKDAQQEVAQQQQPAQQQPTQDEQEAAVEHKNAQQQDVAVAKDEPAQIVIAPCGKPIVKPSPDQLPPCMRPSRQEPITTQEELDIAMQSMVQATSQMVAVSKQLATATQQMLAASKTVAVEVVDTGKEIIDAQKEEKGAVEAPEETGKDGAAKPALQEEVVKTLQDLVQATKEILEVTSEAISKAVEENNKQ